MNIKTLLIVLVVLIVLNNLAVPIMHTGIINLFGKSITLYEIAVFAFLIWLANYLPTPFREIIALILVLWLLSALGFFFFIGWFANILLLIIVLVLILSII